MANLIQLSLDRIRKTFDELKGEAKTLTAPLRAKGHEFLSQPIPEPLKPLKQPLEQFYNTKNPIVSIPREFASGLSSGQTLGQGGIGAPPQTTGQKIAYTAGAFVGAANPKSITGRVISPIVKATNPILAKAISPVANRAVSGRLASGVANVAQGAAINPLYGQKPLQGAALDFITGVAFGPNQFSNVASEVVRGERQLKAPTDLLISHEGAPDKNKVAEYVAKIVKGEALEPIKIIREGAKYGIEDGKHRFEAYKKLGIVNVPVEIVGGKKEVSRYIKDRFGRFQGSTKMGIVGETTGKVKLRAKSGLQKGVRLQESTSLTSPGLQAIKQAGEEVEKALSSGRQALAETRSSATSIPKYAENINLKRLQLKPKEKQVLRGSIEGVKKTLAQAKGKVLSNDEVIAAAKGSEMLSKVVTRDETLKANAQMLKTRQQLVALDKKLTGVLSKKSTRDAAITMREMIESLKLVSAEAADRGRRLQSLAIEATDEPIRQRILKEVGKVETDTEKIVAEALKVNWDNAKSVTNFYRKFVKPSAKDILNEYRYNNMLSNPRTHLRNTFSNLVQTTITRPATLLFQGDVKGVAKYYKGVTQNIPSAIDDFGKAVKGEMALEKPDLKQVPTTRLHGFMTWPSRLMEASDRFFVRLISGGELARGGSKAEAEQIAKYSLFRQEIHPKDQGWLLNKIDDATEAVYYAGQKVPAFRWFVPFVQTPMNFAKQWIEYSPLGVGTIPGTANKKEQLAKAMLGSTFTLMGAQLAFSGKTTWAAPTDPKEKELFYASGRKPFSIQMGDKWVSMMYAGPLAMALALPAAINYYQTENRSALTDSQLTKIGKILSSSAEFLSGQTFLEGIGNFVSLVRGDTDFTLGRNLAYTAGQLVPMQGLVRYVTTALDPIYRKAKTPGEQFKSGVPFMSQTLEPYTNPVGEPSTREQRNLLTPYDVTTQKPEWEEPLKERQNKLQMNNVINEIKKSIERGEEPNAQLVQKVSAAEDLPQEGKEEPTEIDKEIAKAKLKYSTADKIEVKGTLFYKDGDSVKSIRKDWEEPELPKIPKDQPWDNEFVKAQITDYKTELGNRQRDILDLYELGELTYEEAYDEYLRLDELKKSATDRVSKPRKGRKVAVPAISVPKTTKLKVSPVKIKSVSIKGKPPKLAKFRSHL